MIDREAEGSDSLEVCLLREAVSFLTDFQRDLCSCTLLPVVLGPASAHSFLSV
jgi:hypothetical protein